MKKIFVFCLIFFGFFGFGQAIHAEEIKNFTVQAHLASDRLLTITETIQYDFGTEWRHGIYRDIPTVYDRNGAKYRLRLSVIGVSMDGSAVPYQVSSQSGSIEIKIGDANREITGTHTYVISYQTKKAINDFSDHTELYWNVTGNDWQIPIDQAEFELFPPASPTELTCYTGLFGSTDRACTISRTDSSVKFVSNQALASNEGLTVVAAFTPGVIQPLSFWDRTLEFVQDNAWVFVPILVFVVMFVIWFKYGKEPKGRGVVIAQYEEPRELAPAEMAGLMHQDVSLKAITGTILDLGRRGYLKIKFSDADKSGWFERLIRHDPAFSFVKLKPADQDLRPFEKALFDGLFALKDETTVSDLKGKFYKNIADAKSAIFTDLRVRGFFGRNPVVVRAAWIGLAIAVAFASFFFIDVLGPLFIAAGFISALIILLFGWQMPRMTKEGAIVKEECEGFKLFLSVTEKARLEFTDAPAREPEQFARFLPAAVAFGVEDKWAEQFKGLELMPPSYIDTPSRTWTAIALVNAVSHVHAASANTMYSAPRSQAGSGGSGFSGGGSGGGFGGGGGGSW
ncbi:MAG TPA: DUF2207 domain-containing protein [Patescibacteria group bacterium]|nr:DUF2207 domain-containing protein [Patescibacteria group bacterium]